MKNAKLAMGINRIRLEFKGNLLQLLAFDHSGINRIRLEFKDDITAEVTRAKKAVLIESDWNLKIVCAVAMAWYVKY